MFSYLKAHLVEFAFWILIAIAPIKSAMLTIMMLIALDLVTGILAARKRGEVITSAGMRRSLGKLAAYEGALVFGFMIESSLLGDALPLVKIIGGWIGLTEAKSCAENLKDITGMDLFAVIIAKLQGTGLTSSKDDKPQLPPPAP